MDNTGVLSPPGAAELEAIGRKVLSSVSASKASVTISGGTLLNSSFTKNEMYNLVGGTDIQVRLRVEVSGREGSASTDRVDAQGLTQLVQDAEALAKEQVASGTSKLSLVHPPTSTATYQSVSARCESINYSSKTLEGLEPPLQGDIARQLAEMTEGAGMIGAGDMKLKTSSRLAMNTIGFSRYARAASYEYSTTVKTQGFKGSGWGWCGGVDFSESNHVEVTQKAIDIARKSDNPVAVEPGRYTVILEPEAVGALIDTIIGPYTSFMGRQAADEGGTIFSMFKNKLPAGNKIGLQMTDRRLQMSQNPVDPEMSYCPLSDDGYIEKPVQWFTDGILQNLSYGPSYGKKIHTSNKSVPRVAGPSGVRVDFTGKPTTLEEMIASTGRGIWVHRLSNVNVINPHTLLLTGLTRDGTFLIENGRVTKPVKNFRFIESPFFVLAKVEGFGSPVRTSDGVLVPRLIVRDFEFTSLSDAI